MISFEGAVQLYQIPEKDMKNFMPCSIGAGNTQLYPENLIKKYSDLQQQIKEIEKKMKEVGKESGERAYELMMEQRAQVQVEPASGDTCLPAHIWEKIMVHLASEVMETVSVQDAKIPLMAAKLGSMALVCRDFRLAVREAWKAIPIDPTGELSKKWEDLDAVVKNPEKAKAAELKKLAERMGLKLGGRRHDLLIRIFTHLKCGSGLCFAPSILLVKLACVRNWRKQETQWLRYTTSTNNRILQAARISYALKLGL
jgi:hypothetical protein